ncbi:MAG TPA: hypothetical protein VMD25_02835 [Acidobacteriaceae bacterium]|nr:hypothetical protein [Acidobacteriaceae bacterium]
MAHLQDLLVAAEPLFLIIAAIAFFRSGSARRLPALATYFALRAVSLVYLEAVYYIGGPMWGHQLRYAAYFYGYWISYVASAVAIFFVVQEVFRNVLEPVPGLRRLGLLAFRWISIISAVIAIGAIALPASVAATNGDRMGPIALQMMRYVSVMEICLLAFLALSVHAFGRSFRSRLFGIGLGFGIQAAMELITSALQAGAAIHSVVNLAQQITTTAALVTWFTYFVLPEPREEQSIIVLPPQSALARWNALANGLGQAPQVATTQPASGFFLQDIEGVVERVLAKNPAVSSR